MLVRGFRTGIRLAWSADPMWAVLAVGLSAIEAALPAVQLWFTKLLVDGLAAPEPGTDISSLAVGLAVALGVRESAQGLRYFCIDKMRLRAATGIRLAFIDVLCRIPPRLFEYSSFRNEIAAARRAIAEGRVFALIDSVLWAAVASITLVSIIGLLVTISPIAAAGIVISAIPGLWLARRSGMIEARQIQVDAEHYREVDYRESLLYEPEPATELAILDARPRLHATLAEMIRMWRKRREREQTHLMLLSLPASLVSVAAIAIAVFALVGEPTAHAAGDASAVIAGVAALGQAGAVGYALGLVIQAGPPVHDLLAFIKRHSDGVDIGHDVHKRHAVLDAPSRQTTAIERVEMRDVEFSYLADSPLVIKSISLALRAGELTALVGRNGSGKSTLVKLLLGIHLPSSGEVHVVTDKGVRRPDQVRVGVLFQEFTRLELPVRETLTLAGRDDHDERHWSALSLAKADDIVRKLPAGLQSRLGRRFDEGVGLSGGQWQRLALARVYSAQASFWVLDEPTSALDAQAEYQVFSEIRDNLGDRVGLVVSHRLWTVRNADRIIVLDDGQVVQQGTYDELAHSPGPFREMFEHQLLDTSVGRSAASIPDLPT